MKRKQCMNCGSPELQQFIDLGDQPNGNNFPEPGQEKKEILYPISMDVCTRCWQVQIDEFPSPEFLFSEHPYVTGVNVPIVEHFDRLSHHVVEKLDLKPNSLVVDIGCNDGTLLRAFQSRGMRALGVDPGQLTGRLAREHGNTVCEAFWNLDTGRALRTLGLRPELIIATAVFYHLADLHDFIEGLKSVMVRGSVFVAQCVNLLDLVQRNQFDHFYHEHSCIHAIGPLDRLFREHGMRILSVEHVEIHGGSFILYAALDDDPRPTEESVARAIQAEVDAGLHDLETYKLFAERVEANCRNLRELLTSLREQGKTVYALGAPVKGNTLLNYAGITSEHVQKVTEVNEFKVGRLTPGTHIPIVDERQLEKQPDYYLILSWNFLEFLMGKYKRYLLDGGKFIVPVPSVKVLGFDDLGPGDAA